MPVAITPCDEMASVDHILIYPNGWPPICKIHQCSRIVDSFGLCQLHKRRIEKGQDVHAPLRARQRAWGDSCSVEACNSPVRSKGFCAPHYTRFLNGFSPKDMARPFKGNGAWCDWYSNHSGYMESQRTNPETKKKEHRLQHRVVMENHVGRKLVKGENVHHLNGNRSDNRISNLEIWNTSQPPGQRIADKLKWAQEIISLYGGEHEDKN